MAACPDADSAESLPRLRSRSDPARGVLDHCFSLSLRDVELILVRDIVVSYETVRERGLRFDQLFASRAVKGPDLRLPRGRNSRW